MSNVDSRNLRGLLVAVLVSWLLWDSPVLYPVRLFATFCHESGHALTAIATGGQALSMRIAPNAAGVTYTVGGWPIAVMSGGYTGSVFFGCAILLLASGRTTSRYTLRGLGLGMLGLTLAFARDPFTLIYGLGLGAGLLWIGRRADADLQFYLAETLGVLTAGMAVFDIRTLFPHRGVLVDVSGGPALTDAQMLARLTHLPALVWATLWGGVSLVAIYQALRLALRRRAAF